MNVLLVKSMETINLQGVAKFDHQGHDWHNFNGDYQTLLHPKYRSSGPCGFREEDFFSFSYTSMENIDPQGVANFHPWSMTGIIYVEEH